MRTLITIVILSLISQLVVAQKNFEGKIIYKYSGSTLGTGTTEIYFGNQKLKIKESLVPNSTYSDERITDLAKGINYWINSISKTYYEVLLKRQPFDSITKKKLDIATELKPYPGKNKKIMGYNCSAYIIGDVTEASPEMRMPRMAIYMWYADSLFYTIDENYKNANSIEKATNGKNVGMGMEIVIGEDSSLEKIIAEPVSIIADAMPDSLFLVPLGYNLKTEKEIISYQTSDSLEVIDVQLSEVRKDDSQPPPPPPLTYKKITKKQTPKISLKKYPHTTHKIICHQTKTIKIP